MDKFKVQYVVPVTVAAERVQQYSSFGKVTLLAQRYPWHQVDGLLKTKRAFLGIQLNSLDVLDFVDAMTRFAPIAFTLPVRRYGCSWHFHGPGVITFPALGVRSVFQDFLTSVASPRSDDWWMPGLRDLRDMNDTNIWRLLRQVVVGVNDLMAYLNNPLTYIDATGAPNFLGQMKAHGAVSMLFADLAGLNIEVRSHIRITFTFGFLDKLANLRLGMGGGGDEPEIMRNLASLSQGKDLKRLIKEKISPLHPDLVNPLIAQVGAAYWRIHRNLKREVGPAGRSETARLLRLRDLRNVNHGTFLQGDRFDKLFLEAEGTVPREIATLPFLLTLGLILDPLGFLSFRPTVNT